MLRKCVPNFSSDDLYSATGTDDWECFNVRCSNCRASAQSKHDFLKRRRVIMLPDASEARYEANLVKKTGSSLPPAQLHVALQGGGNKDQHRCAQKIIALTSSTNVECKSL